LITINELERYIRRSLAENRNLKGRTITPQLSELGNAEGENDGDFFFFTNHKVVQTPKTSEVAFDNSPDLTPQSSQPTQIIKPHNFPIPKTIKITDNFAIGKYEVTIAEYKACVTAGGCNQPIWLEKDNKYNIDTGSYYDYKRKCLKDNCPIIGVSWHDAKAYTKWLSQKTGATYRLPTEKEWEYVAKAGKPSEWKWSFGNDENELTKYAWYDKNSYYLGENHEHYGTQAVGQKLPNPWEVHDIYGNVWEWCEDWYSDEKKYKNLRGGSWDSSANFTRSALRFRIIPTDRFNNVGFRLLRTLP